MKKLLAFACCCLALHTFSKMPCATTEGNEIAGRRMLIKAIAGIVNSEANRKTPAKLIHLAKTGSPKV